MIESYTMGSSMFDMAAAPHHFEIRRERYRRLDSPAFDGASVSPERVSEISEAAFALGLSTILDHLQSTV